MRVTVREVFPNCPRYMHHFPLVARSKSVPRKAAGPGLEAIGLGLRRSTGKRPSQRTDGRGIGAGPTSRVGPSSRRSRRTGRLIAMSTTPAPADLVIFSDYV